MTKLGGYPPFEKPAPCACGWGGGSPAGGVKDADHPYPPPFEFCACTRFGAAAVYARTTTGICYPYPVHAWERRPLGMGAGGLSG